MELEINQYGEAISTFDESLKLQRMLLSPENPLVISTLDNLGYAFTMTRQYNKAAEVRFTMARVAFHIRQREAKLVCNSCFMKWQIYNELVATREKANSSDKALTQTLRKLVYVQLTLKDNSGALETLRELESIELDLYGAGSKQWRETNRLMGQVNYEVLKHPSIPALACFACGDDGEEEMNLYSWVPKRPSNGSKMSGHRVTYA